MVSRRGGVGLAGQTSMTLIKLMLLLSIAKCGCPYSYANIEGYDNLSALEGGTIRFSCPPGLELIGPELATCSENGEWEPDPSGLICNDSGG